MNTELEQLQKNLEARFNTLETKVDDVRQAVGVLHEEAMSAFRFSLEAVQGTEQQLDARITRESSEIKALIQPVTDAVRHLSRQTGP